VCLSSVRKPQLNVVWDIYIYITDSLKVTTWSKRGKGICRRAKPDTKIPGNWVAFLRVDEIRKSNIFHFLADQLATVGAEHAQVIYAKDKSVVCNEQRDDISDLAPCKHEEADTRPLLHAAYEAKCGFKKIILRITDTDLAVIAVATFHRIS